MKLTIECLSPFSMIFSNSQNILFLQDRRKLFECSFLQYHSIKQTHEKIIILNAGGRATN